MGSGSSKNVGLADVIRLFGEERLDRLGIRGHAREVFRRIAFCSTGHFGYSRLECDSCRDWKWKPRGCKDRHCPHCGAADREEWVRRQEAEVLNLPYFHVVHTMPQELRTVALENRKLIYGLLMRSAKDSIKVLASDRRLLGALPTIQQVLHTSNSRGDYHPHTHNIVSGGGWDEENDKLVVAKNPDYLLPMGAMKAVYRGIFLSGLKKLYDAGKLSLDFQQNKHLKIRPKWKLLLANLYTKPWIVYAKKPFAGPKQVLRYLGRYINRAPISNRRILKVTPTHVTYKYKDRKAKCWKVRRLPLEKFVLMMTRHILPSGFHRVRRSGLLAPAKKAELKKTRSAAGESGYVHEEPNLEIAGPAPGQCKKCGKGVLVLVETVIYRPRGQRIGDKPPPPPDRGGRPVRRREVA